MEPRDLMALGHVLAKTHVGMAVHLDRKTALTFMGQWGLQGVWQLGPFKMISVTLAALGLEQKKQLYKALDRNELVKVFQSKEAAVLCLSHTGLAE